MVGKEKEGFAGGAGFSQMTRAMSSSLHCRRDASTSFHYSKALRILEHGTRVGWWGEKGGEGWEARDRPFHAAYLATRHPYLCRFSHVGSALPGSLWLGADSKHNAERMGRSRDAKGSVWESDLIHHRGVSFVYIWRLLFLMLVR